MLFESTSYLQNKREEEFQSPLMLLRISHNDYENPKDPLSKSFNFTHYNLNNEESMRPPILAN